MTDLGFCETSNIVVSIATSVVALAFLADVLFRDIPNLIAKARVAAMVSVCMILGSTLHHGGYLSPQYAYLPIVFLLPASLASTFYFGECFLRLCVNTVTLNGVDVSPNVKLGIKLLSPARGLGALYAVALVVAFQFEPTNATMVACHSGFVVLWSLVFAIAAIVGFMVHTIVNTGLLTSELKTLIYQMIAFIVACIAMGINNLYMDGSRAVELARDLQAAWQPLPCQIFDIFRLYNTFIVTFIVLYMTRSKHSKRRSWLSSFSSQYESTKLTLMNTKLTRLNAVSRQGVELSSTAAADSPEKGSDGRQLNHTRFQLEELDEEFEKRSIDRV